jgi:cell division protein FtsQ
MRSLKADSADRVLADDGPSKKNGKQKKAPTERAMPKRNRRRKLAMAGAAVVMTAFLGTTAWGLSQGWHLDAVNAANKGLDGLHRAAGLAVSEVTVSGRDRAGPEALRHALGVEIGDPILRLDLDALKARLEGNGWVRTASISRHLPDRLHIAIEERTPFARWQMNGRTALIDPDGEVILKNVGARYRHLPRLVGPQANLRAAELFALLESAPRLAAKVQTANLVRERRWDIGMENGITIRLPEDAASEAWSRFNDVDRRDGLLAKRLKLIDLRVPGRVIVRLKPKEADTGPDRET